MTTESFNPSTFCTPQADAHHHAALLPRKWRMADSLLKRIQGGTLRLRLPSGDIRQYGAGSPLVSLVIHDENFLSSVLRAGDIGFAQAYIDSACSTDNLPGLLELLAKNRSAIESLIYGSWLGGMAYRLRHLLNRNSKAGSRKNIHAHYDIGNDFYRLWLDPSMTYSSALYSDSAAETLQEAQQTKYRRIINELKLQAGQHVLEIGCGWGGFAEMAVKENRVQVTGLTLSTEQLAYAQERMQRAGIADSVTLKLQDYREAEGQFDAIASIEMFEAVGEAYWAAYFACVARNLKAGGCACIQTITIADGLFARYRRSTDFIQQYIFPGGMLPSPSKFRELAAEHGLNVINEFAFGNDYARTLAQWRADFHRELEQVRMLGFDERFIRTWDFYLAYCEAGFRAGDIDVMQFTLQK